MRPPSSTELSTPPANPNGDGKKFVPTWDKVKKTIYKIEGFESGLAILKAIAWIVTIILLHTYCCTLDWFALMGFLSQRYRSFANLEKGYLHLKLIYTNLWFVKGIFLDTETNGLNWNKHNIFEIAFVICDLGTGERIATFSSLIELSDEEWGKSDPESLKFTGITREDLVHGHSRDHVQKEMLACFKSHGIRRGRAIYICQNPSFDRLFFSTLVNIELQEELLLPYTWLDLASMFWTRQIKNGLRPDQIGLSKDMIARHYKLGPEKKPHRALAGVEHLMLCYEKVIGYPLKDKQYPN